MCMGCVDEITGAAAVVVCMFPFLRARVTSWVRRRRAS